MGSQGDFLKEGLGKGAERIGPLDMGVDQVRE